MNAEQRTLDQEKKTLKVWCLWLTGYCLCKTGTTAGLQTPGNIDYNNNNYYNLSIYILATK